MRPVILRDIEEQIAGPDPEGFVYPGYGGYCFSSIPSAIRYVLGLRKTTPLSRLLDRAGVEPARPLTVISFLIDGFGYRQWLEYAGRYEFLNRLTDRGVVAPLTAVFPSTTAAALTTIHSGLTPQQHGLPEWWVYFEELGQIVVTLPFSPLAGQIQDELLLYGADPEMLFHGKTIYDTLAKSGVPSFNLIHDSIAGSAYSSVVMAGSDVMSFKDAPDLMHKLLDKVSQQQGSAYFQVYWGAIDSAAHEYGVHSSNYLAELDQFFTSSSKDFLNRFPASKSRQTIMLVTADHGQINVDPNETLYLDHYPQLTKWLRTGRDRTPILPWGSARDVFLATEAGKAEDAFQFLSAVLKDKATVIKSGDAMGRGLFGTGKLHQEFRSRIGDILVLPHGNQTLWYSRPGHERFKLLGMHGGLSPDEMLVPFAAAKMSELT
jgi:predicted AlkP superfamily pyrophosphatase or phosphodiesterase